MARKVKVEPALLRRLERKEKRRSESRKTVRRYYLIVCEGEKTEPNYFEGLKKSLPAEILEVCHFKILGTGYNTRTLVSKAIGERLKWEQHTARAFDKLWIVFDRDSFPSAEFNAAIQICNAAARTEAAWTNEAFELWYLLHFQDYKTALSRDRFQKLIESNFQSKGAAGYTYKKNSDDMFELLSRYGSLEMAIRRAKTLYDSYAGQHDYADHNPCTTVHLILEEILGTREQLEEEQ